MPLFNNQTQTPLPGFYFEVRIIDDTVGKAKKAGEFAKEAIGNLENTAKFGMGAYKAMKGVKITQEASFQEVSGLKASISTEPIISGGDTFAYQVPKGNVTFDPLSLQRGLIKGSSELHSWCEECLFSGDFANITTKIVVVILMNPQTRKPAMSWVFYGAYPIEYEISGFNAQESQIVVEKIKLVYRNFQKVDVMNMAEKAGGEAMKNNKISSKVASIGAKFKK